MESILHSEICETHIHISALFLLLGTRSIGGCSVGGVIFHERSIVNRHLSHRHFVGAGDAAVNKTQKCLLLWSFWVYRVTKYVSD